MKKDKNILILLACVALFCSVVPLLHLAGIRVFGSINTQVIAFMTIFGWAILFWLGRLLLKTGIPLLILSEKIGVDTANIRLWQIPKILSEVIDKKNRCFSLNVVDQKIGSSEELSNTLERIADLTYRLLNAESVELALYEKDSSHYHSSFVLGKPFSDNPQEYGFDIAEMIRREPNILLEAIAFAGSVRGLIRVKLKEDRHPTVLEKELMSLLATQSTIAIINSEYSTEMIRLKVASEQSVKAKTGFLANLSHEIRGPLGIMLNAVELILDGLCGEINDDQKETLEMVKNNGSHLLDLMNDVLDYAKAESGRITVDKIEINGNELLMDLVKIARAQAEVKKHEMIFTPFKEKIFFECDKRHARQILINVLTNAIKYTPEAGKIEIWIERAAGGKISINVRDNGVGIELDQQHKVFAPFERVDNDYSLKQLGTGLGMSLVKKLIESNSGTIGFESVPGKGTHFWIIFSEKAVAGTDFETKIQSRDDSVLNGEGKEILIVSEAEDNESLLMRRYLEDKHFKITRSSNIDEAVLNTKQLMPDLIIIENDKVDTFGADFVKEFREKAQLTRESTFGSISETIEVKDNANYSVPIVLISNKAFIFDIEDLLKSGVDRCLTRPVEFREIAKVVSSLINQA